MNSIVLHNPLRRIVRRSRYRTGGVGVPLSVHEFRVSVRSLSGARHGLVEVGSGVPMELRSCSRTRRPQASPPHLETARLEPVADFIARRSAAAGIVTDDNLLTEYKDGRRFGPELLQALLTAQIPHFEAGNPRTGRYVIHFVDDRRGGGAALISSARCTRAAANLRDRTPPGEVACGQSAGFHPLGRGRNPPLVGAPSRASFPSMKRT